MGGTRGGFWLHLRAPHATIRVQNLALSVIRVSERLFSSPTPHGIKQFRYSLQFCSALTPVSRKVEQLSAAHRVWDGEVEGNAPFPPSTLIDTSVRTFQDVSGF